MRSKHLWCITLLLMVAIPRLSADSLRIAQIDANRLLINQQITLYLSLTDRLGHPIEGRQQEHFQILESADGEQFQLVPEISSFDIGSNYEKGVSFMLLIDNSESMYWSMAGHKTPPTEERRITLARNAIKGFLQSVNNPQDRIGLAVYNSSFHVYSRPVRDKQTVEQYLDRIERPGGEEIYSEIYGSVYLAIDQLRRTKGRKAIIILSDGVNNPAYRYTQRINPQFGEPQVPFQKPLEALQMEGIPLYSIHFGPKGDAKDRHLSEIAAVSGGTTLDAHDQDELKRMYLRIMDQILKEYVVSYPATMMPTERKHVRVKYVKDRTRKEATRFYPAGTVFGQPPTHLNYFSMIALLLAGLALYGLSRLRFEKPHLRPTIEVMRAGGGQLSTRILTLAQAKTVIGSAPSADMTIAGLPVIDKQHATIVFDKKQQQYTLIGKGKMMVNNQIIKTKILEPGDLINIDGVTMVFDDGQAG
jgi:Ca-activated chloride channel homolog